MIFARPAHLGIQEATLVYVKGCTHGALIPSNAIDGAVDNHRTVGTLILCDVKLFPMSKND